MVTPKPSTTNCPSALPPVSMDRHIHWNRQGNLFNTHSSFQKVNIGVIGSIGAIDSIDSIGTIESRTDKDILRWL